MDILSHDSSLHFLSGGGAMGERMRAHDWSASPLGPAETWPQPLRTATAMMLNTLQPMFIAWGEELAFIYNDAYAPMLGGRHPDALGLPFPQIWSDIWPDLLPLVRSALAGEPVWQEDLQLIMTRHGYTEETYFTFTYSPLHETTGQVGGMFCTVIETTDRVMAERRLRETAGALLLSEERYRKQGERLFALFEEAPGFVAVLDGPDHVFTLTNAAYRQLIGHRNVIGKSVRDALPELKGAGFFQLLDQVYRSGEAYVGAGIAAALQRTPGAPREERFVDFIYQPIRSDTGQVTGIIVQGSDVTERELFVEKQRTLLHELNHRVKNNLATVQSMAAQTARRAPDLKTFLNDFEGRLVALARTHDVLTQNAWSGAEVKLLVERELGAFSDRVRIEGPPVDLDSTQALALGLIIHELATNASKYGALSAAGGCVQVKWALRAGEQLAFRWVERDGPPVQAPTRRGFGSRLMESLAAGDLNGSVERRYPREGFELALDFPLRRRRSAELELSRESAV